MNIISVTPQNVTEETLFCIKNIKSPGFERKRKWFEKRYAEGLQIKILKNELDKMVGFVEYVPSDSAWRPIEAANFMFIHCMYIYSKSDRNQGYGSLLVNEAINDAKKNGMYGVCTMTSKGSWLAGKTLFEKNGFSQIAKKDRFELLSLKWDANAENPKFLDWTSKQTAYNGWHLLYADQCPWHEKSVEAMINEAKNMGVNLKVTKITTAQEAKNAPSGFGVFNLLHNGRLLEDHYLSATRFRNILKKELTKTDA
ncbi:GNAT family N-acetyltransferase [Spongiivirga sp. MCCC 1A20706]|uniref:GNAT family N-acetyltransferase n=1 Tax=Spongiivirga sp. MCCC 1A20706 TaxID=3160963 RepID=UPI003977E0D2